MDVLLGLQWGDEGKGKIVDFLAPKYDIIARFQGGPNAGHTLEFNGHKHVLHQIPSGIFRDGIINVIGNGVVLDPVILKKELEKLDVFKIDTKKSLSISKKAQLILPSHKALDAFYENGKGDNKIGSTLKGIGPTYQDKIARVGLRIGDILSDNFKERYTTLKNVHTNIYKDFELPFDFNEYEGLFFEAVEYLKAFKFIDSEYYLNEQIENNKKILAEGAQGSMLDIDFGSYPFVTSSNTIVPGACTGLGIAPKNVKEVYGIFKAYCTRVGSGPFPTELNDAVGEELRAVGREFGATTGRPRRCGWLDLPALKYTVMLNGVTQLFMMKVDILNTFDTIKACTHYKLKDGSISTVLPYDLTSTEVEPIYKEFKGWKQEVTKADSLDELPIELKEYIQFIEEYIKVPIKLVSFGPDRDQTIFQ